MKGVFFCCIGVRGGYNGYIKTATGRTQGIETMTTYIGRSITTGKYHKAHNPNVTLCNHSGQSRAARTRPATDHEIATADDSMFCRKCFSEKEIAALKAKAA